jgi:hypothetical protein
MTVDTQLLDKIVADALERAAGNVRWENAIRRGAELIRQNRCTPQEEERLLILSTSGCDYIVTVEECRDVTGELCPAFKLNRRCKHRAVYQLLIRYNERAQESAD